MTLSNPHRNISPRVRLITILSLAIIAIIVIIVGVSFVIGNKLSPAASIQTCEFQTDSQQIVFTYAGPDCNATGSWIANQSRKVWVTTTLPPTGALIADDVKGPATLRLYAVQQPAPIHAALVLASGLASAGWRPAYPSGPAVTPAPSA